MKVCGNCELFRPSPYNPASGNGGCKAMEDWEARHKAQGTKPSDLATRKAYHDLGGDFATPKSLWHPKADRKNCTKFKPKKIPETGKS